MGLSRHLALLPKIRLPWCRQKFPRVPLTRRRLARVRQLADSNHKDGKTFLRCRRTVRSQQRKTEEDPAETGSKENVVAEKIARIIMRLLKMTLANLREKLKSEVDREGTHLKGRIETSSDLPK